MTSRPRKAEIVMRKQEIADLKDEKDRWDDPAYVKQQAMSASAGSCPARSATASSAPTASYAVTYRRSTSRRRTSKTEWYDKLWGSVKESGKTPKAAKKTDPDKVMKKQ